MGISIADALFQPGFRFHPTDEELVLYYLKRKICRRRLTLDIISETDVYKWDPQDLPGLSKLKTGDRQWFFFSPRDRKYPNGGRSSRATQHGYWKATGKDRIITCNSRTVGIKKTLVFYTGRAPSGIRTDWVMHEYTLDENELKRCPDVQDYYALYKLFKKSGPGPKNGEQYGAPFKEEDWVDDDLPIINQLSNEVVPVNDFVESVPDQTLVSNYEYLLAQLMNDEEPQSTLVNDVSIEYPEVTTSASNSYKLGPHVIEEDFLEDFLEINDLIGPEPTEKPINEPQNVQLDWSDGLCEFDLFENAAMFGSVEQGQNGQNWQNSKPLMNQTGNEMLGPTSDSHLNNFEDETVSFNHQQWSLDQSTMEANQGTISIPHSSSGVINEGISGTKQNQIMNQDNDSTESSWFSSALWSFVESIPTNPALAADNALVNKASRVNKVKLSNRNANVAPSVTSALGKSKNGLVVFSILGVLCAFLCVFVGTFDTVS